METIIPSILIVLGLLAVVFEEKPLLSRIVYTLIALSLLSVTHVGFGEKEQPTLLLGILAGTIGIGLAAGVLLKKYGEWIGLAGSLLSLLLIGTKTTYFGYELTVTPMIALLPFLGAFGLVAAQLKGRWLGKWFGLDEQKLTTGITAFYAALLVLFATFQAQYFGVVLVASGWLAVALGTWDRDPLRSGFSNTLAGGMALLSIGFLFILVKKTAVDDSFMRGNFLMGLAAGVAAIHWVVMASGAKKLRWGIMYVLPLLVVTAIVMLGIPNEVYGGLAAYSGVIAGGALGLLIAGREAVTVPMQTLLIGLSGIVLTQFAPAEQPKKTSRLDQTEETTVVEAEKPDVLDVKAVPLTAAMSGTWNSEISASKLDFEIGPEDGRTKGSVKDFNAVLKLNTAGEPEALNVSMKTDQVTTFNTMRDESVLGAGFLDAKAFPKMGFTSSGIRKEGENHIASGKFEMLGKKVPLDITFRFAATGRDKGKDFLVMVGKAAIDRRKFGMADDPKMGNIVDVTFEVEFRK